MIIKRRLCCFVAALAALAPLGLTVPAASATDQTAADRSTAASARPSGSVRFATYNTSLNRASAGELVKDLSTPDDSQAQNIAEVLQRVRPGVVLLNEFDYVPHYRAVSLFQGNYLARSQHGAAPIYYPYAFTAPVNTGVPSGHDLDHDGTVGGAEDAFGFGTFPGQYGMVVLSKYPIERNSVRTFQKFLWKDLPGALYPDDPATPATDDWYSPAVLADLRLSSKSHWDVPVRIGNRTVHALVSHPTPPTFDGAEDRNGTRNYDEIKFWADYIQRRPNRWIYDDRGRRGGIRPGSTFVIMGDENSDPVDGDSVPGAIEQLLDSPYTQDTKPTSKGGPQQAALQGGANATQRGNPIYDTADFADVPGPGNIRSDYVLPSRNVFVRDAHVFWPTTASPLYRLTGVYPFPTSDHRLVWADLSDPH